VPGELKSSQPTNESLCCDLAAPASRFRVGVRGWPAFLVWSGPPRPSIPKPLPYPLQPSMRPGSGSSGRGSQPAYARAMREVVGRRSSIWRKGHWRSKRACRRRGSISRCKLSTWAETPASCAGGASRGYGCRQRRLRASAATMAWSTGNIAPLRGFRSPHTALGQIGCPGAIRSCSDAPILSRLSSGSVATCL
jgi:hypothetical protein